MRRRILLDAATTTRYGPNEMGRRRIVRIIGGLGILKAALCTTLEAAAQNAPTTATPEPGEPSAATAVPAPPSAPPGTSPPPSAQPTTPLGPVRVHALRELPLDYNKADPERNYGNYLRAFFGGLFINYAIWQFDWFRGENFHVTHESIGQNFKVGFVFDDNTFKGNFFGHPYHGSMYFGAARGAGLSYVESLPFPWVGSLIWETVGERHFAAPNDWIMTSYGGTVIGEALFRLANEVLDKSLSGTPRTRSEILSTLVSPMYGFQRLTSGQMGDSGPPPKRDRDVRVDLNAGIDRFQTRDVEHPNKWDPTALFAVDVEYGNLLPEKGRTTIDPFEFFELYAAAQLGDSQVSGSQLWIQGIAYGWNSYLSSAAATYPDNNVFGIVQSFDFQGANLLQFGGAGLGLGNYTKWRFSKRTSFRVNEDVQWSLMSGVTSPFTKDTGRTYNFTTGASLGLELRLDSKYGQLGARGKQYYQRTVDGEDGTEFTGYVRAWYEIPIIGGAGLGIATTFVNREAEYDMSQYDRAPSACRGDDPAHCRVKGTGLSWQLYLLAVNP